MWKNCMVWMLFMIELSSAASNIDFVTDFSKMVCISCQQKDLTMDIIILISKKSHVEFLNDNNIFVYYDCGQPTQQYFIEIIEKYAYINARSLETMGIFIAKGLYEKDIVCSGNYSMESYALSLNKNHVFKHVLAFVAENFYDNMLSLNIGEYVMDNPLFENKTDDFMLESIIRKNPDLPLFVICSLSDPYVHLIKGQLKELFNFYSDDCESDEILHEISLFHPSKCRSDQWKNLSLMTSCHYGDYNLSSSLDYQIQTCHFIQFLNPMNQSTSVYHVYMNQENSTLLLKCLENCLASILVSAHSSKPVLDINAIIKRIDDDSRLDKIRQSLMLIIVESDLLAKINKKYHRMESTEIAVHTQYMGYVTFDGKPLSTAIDFIHEQLVMESTHPMVPLLFTGFEPHIKELDLHVRKEQNRRKIAYDSHFLNLQTFSVKHRKKFHRLVSKCEFIVVIYKQSWSMPSKAATYVAESALEFMLTIYPESVDRLFFTVDCFDLNLECNSQNITTYPTVIVYRKNKEPVLFRKELSFNNLVQLSLNLIYWKLNPIESQEEFHSRITKFRNITNLTVLGVDLHTNKKVESTFRLLQEDVNNDFLFISVTSEGLPESFHEHVRGNSPCLIVTEIFQEYNPLGVLCDDNKLIHHESISQFIESASLKHFTPLTWSAFQNYKNGERQLAILFISDKVEFNIPQLLKLMAEFPTLIPLSANVFSSPYHSLLLKEYGGSKTPAIAIVNLKQKNSMLYEGTLEDMAALKSWLTEAVKGSYPTKKFSEKAFLPRSVGVSMNSAMSVEDSNFVKQGKGYMDDFKILKEPTREELDLTKSIMDGVGVESVNDNENIDSQLHMNENIDKEKHVEL